MKIWNYDTVFDTVKNMKCLTTLFSLFLLICGPSNSGKKNVLLHMFYIFLYFDEIILFAKNIHHNK